MWNSSVIAPGSRAPGAGCLQWPGSPCTLVAGVHDESPECKPCPSGAWEVMPGHGRCFPPTEGGQLDSPSAWQEDQAGVDTFKAILVPPPTHSCSTPVLSKQFHDRLPCGLDPIEGDDDAVANGSSLWGLSKSAEALSSPSLFRPSSALALVRMRWWGTCCQGLGVPGRGGSRLEISTPSSQPRTVGSGCLACVTLPRTPATP